MLDATALKRPLTRSRSSCSPSSCGATHRLWDYEIMEFMAQAEVRFCT